MYVIDQINQAIEAKKSLFSIEIVPPLKGNDISKIYRLLDPLMEFKPAFVNVTYHKDEVEYRPMENGLLKRQVVRKRPGTVALAAAINHKYNVTVVPHVTCGGFNKVETENALIDFHFLGIHNLLALRGDPGRNEKTFIPEQEGHTYALELVEQIMNMNKGKYLDEDLIDPVPSKFSVGVAGYPEKHYQASNLDSDLMFLKQKIDAGAQYIVTQMFFDNQKYYDFVSRCRAIGIQVPIIPGLKPLALLDQIYMLPQIFKVDIPEDLAREVRKCSTDKEASQLGMEWTLAQAKDLIKHNVPVLHFYTLGAGSSIRKIAEAIF